MKTEIDELFEFKEDAEFGIMFRKDFLIILIVSFFTGMFVTVGLIELFFKIKDSW